MTQVPLLGGDALMILLVQVAVVVAAALVLGRIAQRFGLPAIVGELTAGVLLGPSLLGAVAPAVQQYIFPPDASQQHLLDAIGQVGILLLVGLSAAQLDTGFLRRRATVVGGVATGAFVLPLVLGVGIGLVVPESFHGPEASPAVFAAFLGVALSVSAIPVIAKTLAELKLLHRNVGQLTLASGAVDDALGWLMLSGLSAVATVGLRADRLALTIVVAVALVPVAWFVVRPLAGRVLDRLASSEYPAGVIPAAVILIIGGAAATQALELEAVLGAFVAGLALGGTHARLLAPLRTVVFSVLAPLFLATAGLRVDLTVLARADVFWAAMAILVLAIVGKFVGAYVGARLVRLERWEALALGAGLNARGAVEIVIAMIGLSLGVLTTESYTVVVLVAVVTSVLAPPLLRATMARVDATVEEESRRELDEEWDPHAARPQPVADASFTTDRSGRQGMSPDAGAPGA
ncbi:cation:proton antiporter [Rhodococcus triatomae]